MMVGTVGRVGVVEQEADLVVGVVGNDAADAVEVLLIHEYEVVEIVIVVAGDLSCGMLCAVYAMGFECAQCHGVNWVAYFLTAGGGGVDLEKVCNTSVQCHLSEDELGGDAATDVAMADE